MAIEGARKSPDRLVVHYLPTIMRGDTDEFAVDVRAGLTIQPKRLFPKYFYDEMGSRLFEIICLLPEYYLTRAENEIFALHAGEIVEKVRSPSRSIALVEMGSGSAQKTRLIIEALLRRQETLLYKPVDISASAIEMSARSLLENYPALRVAAYAGDYNSGIARLRETVTEDERQLVLFLGSNIGNLGEPAALDFLRALRGLLSPGDAVLLGADLKKDAATLEAAYDDELGVTAAFNLNVLVRINRELDADFNVRRFRHVAFYNKAAGRIEIYIESTVSQSVRINKLDLNIEFAAGERIHTENSHKYDIRQLSSFARDTGFTLAHTWFDSAKRFSSNLLVAV